MLADELDYVLGVDTHRDEHVLAVVTAPAGAVIAGAAAPANAHGYRELLCFADRHARCSRLRRSSTAADELATRARAAQPRPLHRGGDRRSRGARTRAAHSRACARAGTTRRARRRTDRRSGADRRLVSPRTRPLRGCGALHTIVLHRRPHDPTTRDYIARRTAEGKSRRDATRILKRYLARNLYRLVEQPPQTT